MKRSALSLIALVSATVLAGPALADVSTGKTREQVKAELAEAIRTGDIIGNAETGQKLNELYPHRYPAKPAVAGKTRQQVKDELSQAQRDGTMPVYVGG